MDLAKALESFNRKERNLLIRDILGYVDGTPPMDPEFRERLENAVELPKDSLEGAWWTTDFHFDWLAGALLTFMKPNSKPHDRDNISGPLDSWLIMANQEDIDLVVVPRAPEEGTQHHLILVEAKSYGHFSREQYNSKLRRLELLRALYKELEGDSPHKICFHHVLCSPNKPKKLSVRHHMKLNLPKTSVLVVKTSRDKNAEGKERVVRWKCEPR